ncbi:kelch domain-containing protein 8A-like [Anneissia japonica]|uniref:kelch domain-containing protein 8A-like n=1 Tax=Anneissia japonica TaxID=1529436 RepID=UPI0014259DD4|nr:kelch domain-containing protein 8A-like [Anneissia japonica]
MAAARTKCTSIKWESLPPMPTKRTFSSATIVNNQLYVIGGCDKDGKPLDTVESLNLTKKKKWQRLLNLSCSRAQPAVVTVGNKIIVIGGVSADQSPLDNVDAYDVEKKTWTALKSLEEKLMGVVTCVHNNNVIVIGGMKLNTEPSEKCRVYDIDKNLWLTLPDMPTARYAAFAHLKGDKLYVFGGRQGKSACTVVEMLDLAEKPTPKWVKLADIPHARVFPSYTVTETHIYSYGGLQQQPKEFVDTFEAYDIEKGEWSTLENMPSKHGDFAGGVVGGMVIASGGLGPQQKPFQDTSVFNPSSGAWEIGPECPAGRSSATTLMHDGKLYVIGGFSPTGLTAEIFILKPA